MNNEESSNSCIRTGMNVCQRNYRPNHHDITNMNGRYCTETIKTIQLSDALVKNKQYKIEKDFNLLPSKMTTSTLCLVYTNNHYTKSPMKSASSHKKSISSLSNQRNKRKQEENEDHIETERGEGLIILDRASKLKDNKDNIKQNSEIYIEDNYANQLPYSTVQIKEGEKNIKQDQIPVELNKEDEIINNESKKNFKKTKLKAKNKSNTPNKQTNNKDELTTQRTNDFFYQNGLRPSPIHQNDNQLYSSNNTNFKASSDDPFLSTSNTVFKDYIMKFNDTQNNNEVNDYDKNIRNTGTNSKSRPCNYCNRLFCNNNRRPLHFNTGTKAKKAYIQAPYTKLDSNHLINQNPYCYDEPYGIKQNTIFPPEERLSSKWKTNYSTSLKPTQYQFHLNVKNPNKVFETKDSITLNENNHSHNPDANDLDVKPLKEVTQRERNESLEMKTKNILFKSKAPHYIKNQPRSLVSDQSDNSKFVPTTDVNNIDNQYLNTTSYNKDNEIRIKTYNTEERLEIDDVLNNPNHTRASSYMFNYDYSIYDKPFDYASTPLFINETKHFQSTPQTSDYFIEQEARSKALKNYRSLSNVNLDAYRKNDYYANNNYNNILNQRINKRRFMDDDSRFTYELNSEDKIDLNNQTNANGNSNKEIDNYPHYGVKMNKIKIPSMKYNNNNSSKKVGRLNKWQAGYDQ